MRTKAARHVRDALDDIAAALPFPLRGIHSDNGQEFISKHLVRYCADNEITFTRSRPGRKNDNAHVEQKNYSVVRHAVGYLRYDTTAELALLNQLYQPLRLMINFFSPQQKLLTKTRHGATVTKKHDTARTPYQRLLDRDDIDQTIKNNLTRWYHQLNPAQLRRDLTDLQRQLTTLSTAKGHPDRAPALRPSRAKTREATNPPSRAS